ncbi:hypothetical protein BKA93DRAFT_187550 [Sparassis latifolia]
MEIRYAVHLSVPHASLSLGCCVGFLSVLLPRPLAVPIECLLILWQQLIHRPLFLCSRHRTAVEGYTACRQVFVISSKCSLSYATAIGVESPLTGCITQRISKHR